MLQDNYNQVGRPLPIGSGGILQFYDPSRLVWLSTFRESFQFGINHKNISGSRYLFAAGKVPTMTNGYPLYRKGIITAMSVSCANQTKSSFNIRLNDSSVDVLSLNLENENNKTMDNLNVSFSNGDVLRCFLNVATNFYVEYPLVSVEVAWT